ncbi:MAG: hypothetical protein R3E13_11845 [Alphaproteobacteria bacterium]
MVLESLRLQCCYLFNQAVPPEEAPVPGFSFPDWHLQAPLLYEEFNKPELIKAIDELFEAVYFKTEDETIEPENVEATKEAFQHFLKRSGLVLSEGAFADILEENSGNHAFRADGKTPNWYHFFRQVLPKLSMLKSGRISEETLNQYGGLDTLIAATLYHDSWEDHGKSPETLRERMQNKIQDVQNAGEISSQRASELRSKVGTVADIVDYCTKKYSILLEDGNLEKTPEGKVIKIERFDGDPNTYYGGQFQHPFALWIKWDDSCEGMSTRIVEDTLERAEHKKLSVASNREYAEDRRGIYGRRENKSIAIKKWPDFEKVFRSADYMLGTNAVMLETVNDYARNLKLKPKKAMPLKIGLYLHDSDDGYQFVPPGWRNDFIQIGRIRKLAKKNHRMRGVLKRAIYPPMRDVKKGVPGISLLNMPVSVPNEV